MIKKKRHRIGEVIEWESLKKGGVLDESLRRELGGEAWRRTQREGLGLLKRRGFSLPLLSSLRSH